MYEREALPRISEVKAVSRPARQQTAVVGTQAAPGSSEVDATSGSRDTQQQQAAQQAAAGGVDARTLQQAVGQLNTYAQNLNRALQFRVDRDSGETVVRVLDSTTDEVIRQIPTEEVLTIANRMRAASKNSGNAGVLIQERV